MMAARRQGEVMRTAMILLAGLGIDPTVTAPLAADGTPLFRPVWTYMAFR